GAVDRFRDVRSVAGASRLPDVTRECEGGQCDRRCVDATPSSLGEEVVSVHSRHRDVTDDHIESFGEKELECIFRARSSHYRRGRAVENSLKHAQRVRLIVDYQYPRSTEIDPLSNRRRRPRIRCAMSPPDTGNRQFQNKCCTTSRAVALGTDSASMELRELLDDREAESESLVPSRRGCVGLPKTLEEVTEERRVDTLAVVANADGQKAALCVRRNLYA